MRTLEQFLEKPTLVFAAPPETSLFPSKNVPDKSRP